MHKQLDFIERLTGIKEAISEAIDQLEKQNFARAYRILENQQQIERYTELIEEIWNTAAEWQQREFSSESEYRDWKTKHGQP